MYILRSESNQYNFSGAAVGLTFFTTFLILPRYFHKKRGFALAFNYAGTAIGKIFLPHLILLLQESYGQRWSILIYGAILLNCCVASALFRPFHQTTVREAQKETSVSNLEYDKQINRVCLNESKVQTQKTPLMPKNQHRLCDTICAKVKESLLALKSVRVLLCSLSIGFFMMSYNNFYLIIPYSMQRRGFSGDDTAWALSCSAFSSVVSRIVMSFLADREWFRNQIWYISGATTAGLSCLGERKILRQFIKEIK